jgi:ABC-2 type transport system ATP-binding protein
MALTADHLIVIGRGKLIADSSTADFIARSTRTSVRVRSPQLTELRTALSEAGLAFTDLPGALDITGAPIEQVGDVAGRAGVTLHELSAQAGSLEEAFMQLTGDAVEYGTGRTATGPTGFGPVPGPAPAPGFGPPPGYPQAPGAGPGYPPSPGYPPPSAPQPQGPPPQGPQPQGPPPQGPPPQQEGDPR